MEIWAIHGVAQEAMRQVGAEYHDIAAIGITNQRRLPLSGKRRRKARLQCHCMAVQENGGILR